MGLCVIGWYGPDRSGTPETGSVGAWLADAGTIARVGAVLACSACSGVVSSCVAETGMGSCPQKHVARTVAAHQWREEVVLNLLSKKELKSSFRVCTCAG